MCCDSKCVPEGPRGLSAYDIWLLVGNTGTEQDFIDSITPPTYTESLITNVQDVEMSTDANFADLNYFQFAGSGYQNLIFTNTTGQTKTFMVTSYTNFGRNDLTNYGSANVDTAIYKRVLGVDTLQSEVLATNSILYAGDPALTTSLYNVINATSDIAEVTLQNNESVLLKFRTKETGSGYLKKASLHVREKL
jgi:hypothetical protein